MQSEGKLTEEIRDGVGRITFSHPQSNSLPASLLKSLTQAIFRCSQDPHCSTILLSSEGNTFCAGASFHELMSLKTPSEAIEFFMGFANVMLAIRDARQPVMVKVQGKAVGGALGLIAAADWAIASSHASVRLSELSIGIGPFTIGPVVVRKIGIGNFQRLSLSTDWQDAQWAATSGLYQEVIPSEEDLDKAIDARISQFSKLDRVAFMENKKLLWSFSDITEESLRLKAQTVSSLLLSGSTQSLLRSLTQKT